MRALIFQMPLMKEVLTHAGGNNDRTRELAEVILPLFEPGHSNGLESRFLLAVAAIPALVFFPSLKTFHQKISLTLLKMSEIMDSLGDLDSCYKRVLFETPDGIFMRLVEESEKDDNIATKNMCVTLKDWVNLLKKEHKEQLDKIAHDSLSRSFVKHDRELKKWSEASLNIPEDTVLTGTSRRVESSFAVLKAFERKFWSMNIRRIYIFAQSKFNCLTEWMDSLKRTDPQKLEDAIGMALYNRKKNQQTITNAIKEDRKKFTKIQHAGDHEEHVRNIQELNRIDQEDNDEEVEEEEEEVFQAERAEENDYEMEQILDLDAFEDFETSAE